MSELDVEKKKKKINVYLQHQVESRAVIRGVGSTKIVRGRTGVLTS